MREEASLLAISQIITQIRTLTDLYAKADYSAGGK